MKTNRIFALLLTVTMLLSTFTGCNTTEPDITDPSGSVGTGEHVGSDETGTTNGTTDTTTGTEDPTGTTGSDPAGKETISGTETTEPSNNPTTNPSTQPSGCSHNWSDWTTKKEATCTADGSEERTCSKCGEKEQRAATTGHTMGSWSTTKKATCDANGVKTRKCSKCGHEETQTIAATGHNWDSGKVTTTPTSCSDLGIKTYTCQTCGKTKTEQIKGSHTFGEWKYEAYTFKWDGTDCPSHRKVRSCTKCGYKEYGNTPDHYCAKGSTDHTVTTIKEGTCTTPAKMRSTCKICGWSVDYDGQKGSHTIKTETKHLTDYGDYTNELDVTVKQCTSCGTKTVVYTRGAGFSDYNRYRSSIGISQGSAFAPVNPSNDASLLDHPTWQTVKRDFVYDSDGYVKQFTLYWWYNGSRYSQVIKCGAGEIEAWFAQYGLTGNSNSVYSLRIYGTEVRPYSVGSSG